MGSVLPLVFNISFQLGHATIYESSERGLFVAANDRLSAFMCDLLDL